MEKFNQAAIVAIEIQEEGKVPKTQYVTIGGMGSSMEQNELEELALYEVKSVGTRTLKEIIKVDPEEYQEFIEHYLLINANT